MSASVALRLDEPDLETHPVETVSGSVESGILILCDHASNEVAWHGEADAYKDILLGWIHQRGDDTDHMAVAIKQRAA